MGPVPVRLSLLGSFEVRVADRSLRPGAWRSRKAATLVKLLALAPGHRLHREQVMELLWPHLGRRAAANNLRRALHATRESLDPSRGLACELVVSEGEMLALCPHSPLWTDAEAFEEAATSARRNRGPAAYEAVLDLYAGELLPEDRYEEWSEEPRVRLRSTYLSLLYELAALHEGRGNLGSAEEALVKLLAEEPTSEVAHASLMRLYALWGRRGEALAQYRRLEEALSRNLGVEPSASVRALREEIAAGRYPQLDSSRNPRPEAEGFAQHNIPAPRTSFVGRERELLEVKRELASTRMLTLTGTGGSGKTRLAMEVARDLAGAYQDGAWITELASLFEGELVVQEVASVLGIREQPGKPLEEALTGYLRDKEVFLLLDNCEHLLDACARLSELLLGACPGLKVLATSREPLGVAGEVVWRVPPLPVPRDVAVIEEICTFEAVRLFVERARQGLPAFKVTPQNVRAVVEVCRRLEGMPLAVELAAARMGTMAAGHLADKLEDCLNLLSSGPRTASPRQRTMTATLEWSHRLLSEEERAAFRRLSVFAGGFTLDAAEAVIAGEGITEGEVLYLVSALVEKSLLVAEVLPGPDAGPRYRMLEPVGHYALENLKESGEEEAVRRRHALWYLEFAERAERELSGPDQLGWSGRLGREHDNLRAALAWSLEGEEAELGLRLATALWLFWYTHGYWSEGRAWLEKAASARTLRPLQLRAWALNRVAYIASLQGDLLVSKQYLEESLALFRRLEDREGIASTLTVLGMVAVLGQEGLETVLALQQEALSLQWEIQDPRKIAELRLFCGIIAVGAGDLNRAEVLFEESLALFREIRDVAGTTICLTNLALMALVKVEYRRASGLLKENLRVVPKSDKACVLHTFFGLACVAAAQGQPRRAARLWGAAETIQETFDIQITPLTRSRVNHEEHLSAARSQLGEAAFKAAWDEGKAMAQEEATEYALSDDESSPSTAPLRKKVPADGPAHRLTRREEEVAGLVGRGLTTNRQLSAELSISERTVETHVHNILKKLGLNTRAQLAVWAAGRSSLDDAD